MPNSSTKNARLICSATLAGVITTAPLAAQNVTLRISIEGTETPTVSARIEETPSAQAVPISSPDANANSTPITEASSEKAQVKDPESEQAEIQNKSEEKPVDPDDIRVPLPKEEPPKPKPEPPDIVAMTFHDIHFEFDKYNVIRSEMEGIRQIAQILKKHPYANAFIEGHTDNEGSREYNKWLSQRRAESVIDILVAEFSIRRSRLTALGMGEDSPMATNTTDKGRQLNRRVVLRIRG